MTEEPVSIKAVPGLTVITKSEEHISPLTEDPVTFADIKDSGVSFTLAIRIDQSLRFNASLASSSTL